MKVFKKCRNMSKIQNKININVKKALKKNQLKWKDQKKDIIC